MVFVCSPANLAAIVTERFVNAYFAVNYSRRKSLKAMTLRLNLQIGTVENGDPVFASWVLLPPNITRTSGTEVQPMSCWQAGWDYMVNRMKSRPQVNGCLKPILLSP